MKKTLITDWQSLEKILEDAVTESLRGDNWKKFAKPKSKRTNKQDSDQFALSKFVELLKKWWKKG